VGDVVSEWILKGAFPASVNWGAYSWDTVDAAIEITVEMAVDYCILNF
jgi:hypothetical protein